MRKIMFNDSYGLTRLVLDRMKTQTRRAIPDRLMRKWHRSPWSITGLDKNKYLLDNSPYKTGDVVAVAQSYAAVLDEIEGQDDFVYLQEKLEALYRRIQYASMRDMPGYRNKMFVSADLMPHRIRISGVRVEKIRDISEGDCLREGIREAYGCNGSMWTYDGAGKEFPTAREAYASLLKRIGGRMLYDYNGLVFVYDFELV